MRLPAGSLEIVVIVILRPSEDMTLRLLATTCRSRVYEATTVRESIFFSDTGSIIRRAPITTACLLLHLSAVVGLHGAAVRVTGFRVVADSTRVRHKKRPRRVRRPPPL
jgi:hypothetical protein